MKPPWWLGLGAVSAEVRCSGTWHRIEWSAGGVHALDHDDTDGELSLTALGGGVTSYCLGLADAWHRHASDAQLVTVGRRPGETPISYPHVHSGSDDMARLLSMPGLFVDRLVLTAMATCAERWADEAFRAEHGLRVGAALSVRATPALRRFGERLGRDVPTVAVSPSQPGAGPSITARLVAPDQPIVVTGELPVAWLVDVWGRGISEPGDHLVLGVRDADEAGRELLVDVAEWEPAGPITWELASVLARLVRDEDTAGWRVERA